VTVGIDFRSTRGEQAIVSAAPGLADRIETAQRITITSGDASYRIERVQRGGQDVWVMRDRGDYPVEAAPLARLKQGLQGLQLVRRMTSDPSKHERLGVGDPRQGGRGVLVQIEDANRALLVDLILGVEPNGGLYARRTGEDQVWQARGDLPPLRDVAIWMNLRPLEIEPQRLARVEIVPAQGRPYILAREEGASDFAIVSPRLAPLSPGVVTAAAERITQLAPIDVQPAPAIQGVPASRLRLITTDGVLIDGELIESDGKIWLKLVARAQTPEQEPAALELNGRLAEWAFALNRSEAEELTPPLSNLVPSAGEE